MTVKTYISVNDTLDWYAQHQNPAWAELSSSVREAYLLEASRWIDQHFTFRGRKLDAGQARSWPRVDAYADDGTAFLGVPDAIIDAVLILAPVFIEGEGAVANALGIGQVIKQQKIGGVEVVFDTASSRSQTRIERILAPLLMPRHVKSLRRC